LPIIIHQLYNFAIGALDWLKWGISTVKGISMLKYTEGYLKLDGINIHYYRTGGGKPPFILLHGATDNGLCWTRVAELLAAQYDVIMPDAQGHGLSARLDAAFASKRHTEQVVGLVRELGLKKPFIMGHSMGAGTAVDIAVDYPALPRAIILEDPAWRTPESIESENDPEKVKQREAFMKALAGYGKHTLEEIIADGRAANPRWSEAELVPWAKAKLQFDPSLFSKPILNQLSYVDLVPKIKCPTLLIISDGGLVTAETAEHASRLWKSRRPFKSVRIKGAGHNIRREQFEAFKDALFSFLKTC
jgi:pimeloyl-ACP methyl ester carboxylesterase